MDKQALEAVAALNDRACNEIGRYTVPFFKYTGEEARLYGSGVLLRVADAHFVATACHVIDDALPQETWPFMEGSPVFIGVGPSAPRGIALSGHGVHRVLDPTDLALIELNDSDAATFNLDKRFLNLGSCDARPLDMNDVYLVLGFPSDDSTQDLAAKEVMATLHGYFTTAYRGDRGEIPEGNYFDKDINVAFDHNPGDERNYEGDPTGFPRPGGASGCGIWKLNVAGRPPEEWEPGNARLVAIFHSVHIPTQTTIGTRISYLIALLRQKRPELQPAIDLTFPGR